MTYLEWRDELNNNLLSVSESERRRVLDYYAEAYADRREAGFSEKEIIAEFGAPYDAARRILSEGGYDSNGQPRRRPTYNAPPPNSNAYYNPPPTQPVVQREDYTWLFVLLCIVFCVPLFGLIMAMVGITIGFCAAPIAVIGSGAAFIGRGIGSMFTGDVFYGLSSVGTGLITLGVGIVLCPLFFKLVKIMWQLFQKVFNWIKSYFSGKRGIV